MRLKKPGFLPRSRVLTKYLGEKTRFLPTCAISRNLAYSLGLIPLASPLPWGTKEKTPVLPFFREGSCPPLGSGGARAIWA
jgi:hypothetical protein